MRTWEDDGTLTFYSRTFDSVADRYAHRPKIDLLRTNYMDKISEVGGLNNDFRGCDFLAGGWMKEEVYSGRCDEFRRYATFFVRFRVFTEFF